MDNNEIRMGNGKNKIGVALPVLFGFFVMGFCDIVGISSDYAASAFGWDATMTGLIPSAVFVWFFFLGVPVGLLMNRIGRKNTVLLSCVVTVLGMMLPLVDYTSVTTLVAYALLGIGNAILQVSLNPLLGNVITDGRLLTSALTAGQVVKAVSSFVGPFIVMISISLFGHDDEALWYLCFPVMGAITLISGLWLFFTPIPREAKAESKVSIGGTLSLLAKPTLLLLFFGIFFAVATDVSTNFISSKVMINRYGYTKEMASMAPQVYFVMRTIGSFIGVFAMTRIAERTYLRYNMIACIVAIVVLALSGCDVLDFICIGAIGFLCSCVFPIIYGMAIKSMPDKANEISGLMIMAVAGGTASFLVGAAMGQWGVTGGIIVILAFVVYLTCCSYRRF